MAQPSQHTEPDPAAAGAAGSASASASSSTQHGAALAPSQGQELHAPEEVDFGDAEEEQGRGASEESGSGAQQAASEEISALTCKSPPCRVLVDFDGTRKCFVLSNQAETTHHITKVLVFRLEVLQQTPDSEAAEFRVLSKEQVMQVIKMLRAVWEAEESTTQLAKARHAHRT